MQGCKGAGSRDAGNLLSVNGYLFSVFIIFTTHLSLL